MTAKKITGTLSVVLLTILWSQCRATATRANEPESDPFGPVAADLQGETDSIKIIKKVFEGFPGNVLKAEPVGQPSIISKTATDATVAVKVRFSVDMMRYGQWHAAMSPVLRKVATKTESFRWNPEATIEWSAVFAKMVKPSGVEIPAGELIHIYNIRAIDLPGIPPVFPQTEKRTLFLVERQGRSSATMFYFDDKVFKEVFTSATSVPFIEVALEDTAGNRLAERKAIAIFRLQWDQSELDCNLSWQMSDLGMIRMGPGLSGNIPVLTGAPPEERTARWRVLDPTKGWSERLAIIPYMSYLGAAGPYDALAAFTKEIVLKVPVESLSQLGSVEAKIWSKSKVGNPKKNESRVFPPTELQFLGERPYQGFAR